VSTVQAAIECEAFQSKVSLDQAADVILQAAREWTRFSGCSCPAEWQRREVSRLNTIDRFWFEDSRWTSKAVYAEFRAALRGEAGIGGKDCSRHPQSGLTENGTCWACYAESYGYEVPTAGAQ
jgi:hypothetical protein